MNRFSIRHKTPAGWLFEYRVAAFLGIALIIVSDPLCAARPIRLISYPQKVRTFYALDSTEVPAEVRSTPVPLPAGNVTSTVRAGDGAIWLGTTQGLVRIDYSAPARDQRQFLAGKRYLPDDHIEQLFHDSENGVWVRTRTGISHIALKPMTLSQKARLFEARIQARHDRYGLVADSAFESSGDPSSNRLMDSDNDGL